MDADCFKLQPVDEQTRMENERRELLAAYRLVRAHVRRTITMRIANKAAYSQTLADADSFLDRMVERLEHAE